MLHFEADNHKSELFQHASPMQKSAAYVALISAVVALFFLVAWMGGEHTSNGCLGGFNFNELIFNFHPVFMYTGMIICGLSALLSYRVIPLPKPMTKKIHGLLHTLALCFIIMGLTCVFVGNNFKSKNTPHVFYQNLTSIHSYLGLGAVCVYFQNYIFGIYHFLTSLQTVPVEVRKEYKPMHIFFGMFSWILALMAVFAGIMEVQSEIGCYYDLTAPDLNPASHYHLLSYGCKLANGVGVITMLVAVFGLFALFNFPGGRKGGSREYAPLMQP
jgi:hypothetical protein